MPRVDNVRQLVEHFERAILAGEYAPGDFLPPEREISASMGVSRSVVREALGRLASLGLVRSQHGSGTRVAAPSGKEVTAAYQRLLSLTDFRMEHLAEVRLPLETTIARLAAAGRTEEHLVRMEEAQKILANPRRSLESHVEADLEFHAALADASGNPLFRTMLSPIQQLLIDSRRRTLGRYGSEIAHHHHARILDAVRGGNAIAAEEAMREHIQANTAHLHEVGDV